MTSESDGFTTSSDDPSRSVARRGLRKDDNKLKDKTKGAKRLAWTVEEEIILAEKHAIHGNAWTIIAKSLPGRSPAEVKSVYYNTFRSPEGASRSLLHSYVLAVQGHEDDDDARNKAYNTVLKVHEEEAAAAGAAAGAEAAPRSLLGNPAVPPQAIIGLLGALPGWPLGQNLLSSRLNPQDKLRLTLLQQHHINLLQLKQQQVQELGQQQEQQRRRVLTQGKQESGREHGQYSQRQQEQPKSIDNLPQPTVKDGSPQKIDMSLRHDTYQATVGEKQASLGPEGGSAAAAPTAAALERISPVEKPSGQLTSEGHDIRANATGPFESTCSVVPVLKNQPPVSDKGPHSMGVSEHDIRDTDRQEEQRAHDGQDTAAEVADAEALRTGPGTSPQVATSLAGHNGDDDDGIVGDYVDVDMAEEMLPPAAPSSQQPGPAAVGSRKRSTGVAASKPGSKRVKRHHVIPARGSRPRREDLLDLDACEPLSPPQQSPEGFGLPGGTGQQPAAEARRVADIGFLEEPLVLNEAGGWQRREQVEDEGHDLRQARQHQPVPRMLPPHSQEQTRRRALQRQESGPQPQGDQEMLAGDQEPHHDVRDGRRSAVASSEAHAQRSREADLQRQVLELQRQLQQLKEDIHGAQKPLTDRKQKGNEQPTSRRKSARKFVTLAPGAGHEARDQERPCDPVKEAMGGTEAQPGGKREQQREEEENARMHQQVEMDGEDAGWEEHSPDWLAEGVRAGMPPGRIPRKGQKPKDVEFAVGAMLDSLLPPPDMDPPMVLLRRDAAPPILCVAVPLGVVASCDLAVLAQMPVADIPPGEKFASPRDNMAAAAAAAASHGAPPLEDMEQAQVLRRVHPGRRCPNRAHGHDTAADRCQGFEALAEAVVAAAAAVSTPEGQGVHNRVMAGDAHGPGGRRGRMSDRGSMPTRPVDSAREDGRPQNGMHGGSGAPSPRDMARVVRGSEQALEAGVAALVEASGGGGTRPVAMGARHSWPGVGKGGSERQEAVTAEEQQRSSARWGVAGAGAEVDAGDDSLAPRGAEPPQATAPRDPRRRVLSRPLGKERARGAGIYEVGAATEKPRAAREADRLAAQMGGSSDHEKDDAGQHPCLEGNFRQMHPQAPVPAAPFLPGPRLMGPLMGPFMGPFMSPFTRADLMKAVNGGLFGAEELDEDVGTVIAEQAYDNLRNSFGAIDGLGTPTFGLGERGINCSTPTAWAAAAAAARRGARPFVPPQMLLPHMMSPQALYGMPLNYLMTQMASGAPHAMAPPGQVPSQPLKTRKSLKQPRPGGTVGRETAVGRDQGRVAIREPEQAMEEEQDADPRQPSSRPGTAPHLTSRSGRKIIRRFDNAIIHDVA